MTKLAEIFKHEKNIIDLYTNKQKSINDISKLYDVWNDVIKKVLVQNNIVIRYGGFQKGYTPHNKGKTKENCVGVLKQNLSYKNNFSKGLFKGSFAGKKHSLEIKQKIKNSMLGNKNATHRVDRQNFYKGVRMDSKWEVATAKYFDSEGINWKYNEKGYCLSNGSYLYPDFFIYENGIFTKLIEVKGLFRERNKQKFDLFKKEYPEINIELWHRRVLFEKGIIDVNGYARE